MISSLSKFMIEWRASRSKRRAGAVVNSGLLDESERALDSFRNESYKGEEREEASF